VLRRLTHLRQNVGLWALIRWAFVLVLVIAACVVLTVDQPSRWPLPVACALGLALPYAGREAMVARPETCSRVLQVAVVVLLASLALGRELLRKEPWAAVALGAAFSTYLSAYFWLLSDERIETERSTRAARK